MVNAVIFDVANVIVDWEPSRALRGVLPDEEVDAFIGSEAFIGINHECDSGMSLTDAVLAFEERYPNFADTYRLYLERFPATVTGLVPGTTEVIRELLARGVPTFGLSNWASENFEIAHGHAPVLRELLGLVVSADVNLAKPDPAVFMLTLKKFGLEAADTVMVDDTQVNLDSARAIGMPTLLFTSAARLRTDLVALGLL